MNQKNTHNPHDTFAKEVLSDKENAIDFFQGILPEYVARSVDLNTLALDKTSYTDETLSEYFSDLVFTCRCRGKSINIALLFEHKSYVPQFPFYQLLRYINNIWYQQMKSKEALPVILPVILYHGKQRWNKRALSEYLSVCTGEFMNFIPEFDYILVDLSNFSEEKIKSVIFRRTAVQLWLLVQKYIYDPVKFRSNLKKIFRLGILYFSEEEGLRFIESLCRYVFFVSDIPEETIIESVKILPAEAREAAMTTAERLINKGREEGIQRGIQEGITTGIRKNRLENARKMLEEGLDVLLIEKITGLSEEEIRKMGKS